MPNNAASSGTEPTPMPNRNLPPLRASRVAARFASRMGECSGTTTTAVPSMSVLVVADARASMTNGSTISPQARGMSRTVSTGSVGCSGAQSESNPSSSARGASTAGSMERCVGSTAIPTRKTGLRESVHRMVHRYEEGGPAASPACRRATVQTGWGERLRECVNRPFSEAVGRLFRFKLSHFVSFCLVSIWRVRHLAGK